jgi:hypothetical protein
MASADISHPAACLQSLPHEVLLQVVALCASWATPEELLRCGSLCRSLRAAVGCPSVAALHALWARTIVAAVDPCAALARADDVANADGLAAAYAAHAVAHARAQPAGGIPGWFALAHALAARRCVACGVVTPWVAWRERGSTAADEASLDAARNAVCRCCESCAPPPCGNARAAGFASDDDEVDDEVDDDDDCSVSAEDAPDEDAGGDADDDGTDDDDEDYDPNYRRCTLINAFFFAHQPCLVLDAAALPNPSAALHAAIAAAHDGDTIGLRGRFVAPYVLMHGGNDATVRLLGVPESAAYRNKHIAVHNSNLPQRVAALGELERTAAASVPFPAASIVMPRGCLKASNPAWLESLFIRSGDARCRQRHNGEDYYVAVKAYALEPDMPPPSVVLRRCWLSAYDGAGVGISAAAAVALLRCVITNSGASAVFCQTNTTLRLRGCHILWNMRHLGVGDATEEAEDRVACANVFVPHPHRPGVGAVEHQFRALVQDVLLLD